MMRPRLASSTVTSHSSSYEESYSIEQHHRIDAPAIKDRIRELEAELLEIEAETKEEERVTRKFAAIINEITIANRETKQSLDEALSWPNSLLKNSEKWLAIWESELGKKALNTRSAKKSENAILLSSVTKQVEYAREWIARFRERKLHYETTGNRVCEQMKDDFAAFEYDVHGLRRDCFDWEKRAAYNHEKTLEMSESKKALDEIIGEKKMLIAETKNDINEFERELLAISYTLDQIVLQ